MNLHQYILVKDSTFAKSVAKSGDNNVDFNEAVLENGAEMANTMIKKQKRLYEIIYTLVTSKMFQDDYR